MATAVLNISDYTVYRLAIEPRTGVFDANSSILCQVGVQFAASAEASDEHRFRVALGVRLHDEGLDRPANLPYLVTVNIQGQFETPWTVLPTSIPAPLVLNALTILYGIVRGIVGQATATFIEGQLVVPAITFDSVVDRALSDPNTPVAPTLESVTPDPVAVPFFRFMFALEDFPLSAGAVSNGKQRELILRRFNEFVTAFNAIHETKGEALDNTRLILKDLASAVEDVSEPIAGLLRAQIGYITATLDATAKIVGQAAIGASTEIAL